MNLTFDPASIADYEKFLQVKRLPKYRIVGRGAYVPDEYAGLMGTSTPAGSSDYIPLPGLFDYQRDITAMAIRKRKFAAFVEPGLGKTLIQTEFARHASERIDKGRAVLMIAPPMVVPQTVREIEKFYGDALPVERISAKNLTHWLESGTSRIGITNYEALKDETPQGRLGALILDESSMLKSAYGKQGGHCIRLGRGLHWKLCATGTPAPNDRIEFANHAVFLDVFPTVNSFLARFFVNRGQTDNRWELKPHALRPFYRALSHWCLFLTNPATYGWSDNAEGIPPINVHIHEVDMTSQQWALAGEKTQSLFGAGGGIGTRAKLAQIAKGSVDGRSIKTYKPEFIRQLVRSWPNESTLVWCLYDREQDSIERVLNDAASIRGSTPYYQRQQIVDDFCAGKIKTLITKPKILGFGLNLQVATRQVFSGLQDSYETYFQAVKRSNRVGSQHPLNVHIPITAIERPMIETVLTKARRVEADTREQEAMFKQELSSAAA